MRIALAFAALLTGCQVTLLDVMPGSHVFENERVTVQVQDLGTEHLTPLETETFLACATGIAPASVHVVYTETFESARAWYDAGVSNPGRFPEDWLLRTEAFMIQGKIGGRLRVSPRDGVLVIMHTHEPGEVPALILHEYIHMIGAGDWHHRDPIWGTIPEAVERCRP